MKHPYASPGLRLIAFLFDVTILWTPVMLLGTNIVLLSVWRKIPRGMFDNLTALSVVSLTVISFLYFTLSQGSAQRATVGQRILHIFVADQEMKTLSYLRAAIRYAPLAALFLFKPIFLKSTDLPSLTKGSPVHLAALALWFTIVGCYLYTILDSQRASVIDRLLSVRVYRNQATSDFTVPQVQAIMAIVTIFLCVLPLFRKVPPSWLALAFICISVGLVLVGWRAAKAIPLRQYLGQVLAFPRVIFISMVPSIILGLVTWGVVLYWRLIS
jgi:uncharacterized RDD family membrane protein YckC